MLRHLRFVATAAVIVGLGTGVGAQWPDRLKRAIGGASNAISLDRLLDQRPLTTTLRDAYPDVPFLDVHDPERFEPIAQLPAARDGWRARAGAWGYVSQSYCLKAGTHGPSQGRGYLAAPLKGPQADTIRSILRNSAREPDIPQRDVQLLLWRIIARARFDQLPTRQKEVAARLLTPEQIARLNTVRLDLLTGSPLNEALKTAPPEVRQVLNAEAEMRRVLASGNASYEQVERLAVLPGAADDRDDSLAPGRWTYNPAGYFVRYFPKGYSTTIVHVDVPGPIVIKADALGRITSLADPDGRRRLQLTYNERPGGVCPDDKGVRAELVPNVRFEMTSVAGAGGPQSQEWHDQAVILTGVPTSKRDASAPFGRHYNTAREIGQRTEQILAGTRAGSDDRQRLANVVHLAIALDVLLAENGDKPEWAVAQRDLVFDAWQYEVCRAAGACRPLAMTINDGGTLPSRPAGPTIVRAAWHPASARAVPALMLASGWGGQTGGTSGGDGGGTIDPSDTVAQPGTDGKQRLGQSSRSFTEWLDSFQKPYEPGPDRALAHNHRIMAGIGASTLREGYEIPVSSYCKNNPNCWRR